MRDRAAQMVAQVQNGNATRKLEPVRDVDRPNLEMTGGPCLSLFPAVGDLQLVERAADDGGCDRAHVVRTEHVVPLKGFQWRTADGDGFSVVERHHFQGRAAIVQLHVVAVAVDAKLDQIGAFFDALVAEGVVLNVDQHVEEVDHLTVAVVVGC